MAVCLTNRQDSFLDALPSRIDPSIDGGPVALPAAAAIMHGKRQADLLSTPHLIGTKQPQSEWCHLAFARNFVLADALQYKLESQCLVLIKARQQPSLYFKFAGLVHRSIGYDHRQRWESEHRGPDSHRGRERESARDKPAPPAKVCSPLQP